MMLGDTWGLGLDMFLWVGSGFARPPRIRELIIPRDAQASRGVVTVVNLTGDHRVDVTMAAFAKEGYLGKQGPIQGQPARLQ